MKIPKSLFIVFILSAVYFLSRLFYLTSLPIFADEAIYIRWAQIMKSVETLRFLPLTDGKQPLFMWLIIPFLKFISNPLVSGRLVSVFSGFIGFLSLWVFCGIFDYSKEVPKNPLALLARTFSTNIKLKLVVSLLFLSNPYTYFFNRLATADDLLATFLLISANLSILQTFYSRFDLSLLLGGVLGLAWLTKSPAAVFFLLILIYQLINSKNRPKTLLLSALSGVLMFSIYNILRLGPQYHMIALRNQDYIWPLSEIIKHPLDPLKPHFLNYLGLLWHYLGPIILLIPVGFFANISNKSKFLFALFFLFPALGILSSTKVLTARYLLFILPFLLFFLGQIITTFSKKFSLFFYFFILYILVFGLKNSVQIALNPSQYQFPQSESGYVNDWTSGWGIQEIANYAKIQAQNGRNVILAAEGNFGNPKDGLQMYLNNQIKTTVISQEPLLYHVSPDLEKAKNAGDLVLIVHNSQRFFITDPILLNRLDLLLSFKKPDNSKLLLYQLK